MELSDVFLQTRQPELKVSNFEDVAFRTLETVMPFGNGAAIQQFNNQLSAFGRGKGIALHSELVAAAKDSNTSFVDEVMTRYWLSHRDPLYMGNSYGCSIPLPVALHHSAPYVRVAHVMVAIAKTAMDMINGTPPSAELSSHFLCLRALGNHFCAYRVPSFGIDVRHTYPAADYAVLIHNNAVYKIDLIEQGQLQSVASVALALKTIFEAPHEPQVAHTAALTSLPREQWAFHYGQINKDPVNAHTLDIIHKSLFAIRSVDANTQDAAGNATDISYGTPETAWFDKSSFVSVSDRHYGLTVEHSCNDGLLSSIMAPWVHQRLQETIDDMEPGTGAVHVNKYGWRLSHEQQRECVKAAADARRLQSRVHMVADRLQRPMGVGLAQLHSLVMLAWKTHYGKLDATYVPARVFSRYARNDRVLAQTRQMQKFLHESASPPSGEMDFELFQAAAESFKRRALDTSSGRSPTLYFAGLAMVAGKEGLNDPVFDNPLMRHIMAPVRYCATYLPNAVPGLVFSYLPGRNDTTGLCGRIGDRDFTLLSMGYDERSVAVLETVQLSLDGISNRWPPVRRSALNLPNSNGLVSRSAA